MTVAPTDILIRENVSLAPLTTLKIGGASRFFVEAKTEKEVSEAVLWAKKNDLPLFVIGGGSNVLIADEGFQGLVLKIALKGVEVLQDKNNVLVKAQAGEDWDEFTKICVAQNLQGVECLSGIPGSVGGTPVQNVGAYGQEVSETIVAARVLEIATGKIFEMSNADCGFAYRASVFNTTRKNQFIVLAATFNLIPHGAPKISYRDLREIFGDRKPSLRETRQAVLEIRARKSMVIDARDPNSKSAGSFFKNPVVGKEKFAAIEKRAIEQKIIGENEKLPSYEIDENSLKIPAAWMIEKAGFVKGFECGRVGLSSNHTLAIVNRGNAAARDVINLMRKIQSEVEEKFDIKLNPEPVFIGFSDFS